MDCSARRECGGIRKIRKWSAAASTEWLWNNTLHMAPKIFLPQNRGEIENCPDRDRQISIVSYPYVVKDVEIGNLRTRLSCAGGSSLGVGIPHLLACVIPYLG